jgi:transcriptional regulator with XRE-family HTH domain
MVNPMLLSVKAKKLGVLLRDARTKRSRSLDECAEAIGTTPEKVAAFEEGALSPSLPEIELLAYFLDIPPQHFLVENGLWEDDLDNRVVLLEQMLAVRQRTIGVILRKARSEAGISLEDMAGHITVSAEELDEMESGKRSIDLPRLEVMADTLGLDLSEFQDQRGPVSKWLTYRRMTKSIADLPPDLQEFVCKPFNRPYLEVAQRLSLMPISQLRELVESLQAVVL